MQYNTNGIYYFQGNRLILILDFKQNEEFNNFIMIFFFISMSNFLTK